MRHRTALVAALTLLAGCTPTATAPTPSASPPATPAVTASAAPTASTTPSSATPTPSQPTSTSTPSVTPSPTSTPAAQKLLLTSKGIDAHVFEKAPQKTLEPQLIAVLGKPDSAKDFAFCEGIAGQKGQVPWWRVLTWKNFRVTFSTNESFKQDAPKTLINWSVQTDAATSPKLTLPTGVKWRPTMTELVKQNPGAKEEMSGFTRLTTKSGYTYYADENGDLTNTIGAGWLPLCD